MVFVVKRLIFYARSTTRHTCVAVRVYTGMVSAILFRLKSQEGGGLCSEMIQNISRLWNGVDCCREKEGTSDIAPVVDCCDKLCLCMCIQLCACVYILGLRLCVF